MADVGVWTAMQLDINNYWVHFDAMRDQDGQIIPDPLFSTEMNQNSKRFLSQYARDFFYITRK